MSNKIISLVGMCGTGKSEVANLVIRKTQYELIYFGGVVLEEVRARGLDITPANERFVRESLRTEHGMAAMAKLSVPHIDAALKLGGVVVDGLYSYPEYEMLKSRYGSQFYLVAVHSNKEIRYKRLCARPIRPLTPKQVDERDISELLHLDKGGPIAIADYHVLNNGTLEDLSNSVFQTIERIMVKA